MKIYPDTKIYVLCPANFHTGGVELLHQLCSQMLQFGFEAQMYYGSNSKDKEPVDDFYKKYHLPYSTKIFDTERNILICFESGTKYLYDVKNIRKVIWWLSVDNYVESAKIIFYQQMNNFLQNPLQKPLKDSVSKNFWFQKEDSDIEHWVQSEYARQFIRLNGIYEDKIYFVGDYLNQAFLSKFSEINFSAKENWVAYNPKKGFEVTQKFINYAPEIKWKPIENMTPEQVQELLAKCKVYIDFGNHPGRDRIPREAALSGCVVITNKRGAAANNIDINISEEFKFDDQNLNCAEIISKIKFIFENFDSEFEKQKSYRDRILDDKKRFENEVAFACPNFQSPPPAIENISVKSVAILNLSDESADFANFLLKTKSELIPTFIIDDRKNFEGDNIKKIFSKTYLVIDEKNSIEVISKADAKFLLLEGRIKYLAAFSPSAEEIEKIKSEYPIAEKNILVISR